MKTDGALPARLTGLAESEARVRLATEGPNELLQPDRRTPLRIVMEVLREPMFALLIGGGVIYLLLGDVKEALILLAFALLSIAITVVQETRTEHVLEALRNLASPRALVIRDGVRKRISGREVVRGDVILLAEGDRVPADALLLEAIDLQADESLLTGESVPVRKLPSQRAGAIAAPGGEDLPYVYSGSLVVRGSGTAEVIATGANSQMGKIGQLLHRLEPEPPRLQTQTRDLVRVAAIGGGTVSVIVMVLYGLFRGGWLEALLAGITIGMSMLPEEFPVVLTVFMAMGAWRISHARVLTRRSTAIEALGSATVLCTDKTGTLTENRMSVAELRTPEGEWRRGVGGPIAKDLQEVLTYGILASAPEALDPMERALRQLADSFSGHEGHPPRAAAKLARTYGLRPELLAVTQVWASHDGSPFIVATKGAPESVGRLCQLSAAESANLQAAVDAMAAEGMRVLAVAQARYIGPGLPDAPTEFAFRLLGLIGFADPLRESVPAAVRQCQSAGIRVVMITGDYPATAVAIARQAGLAANKAVGGDGIAKLDDTALISVVRSAAVFARIVPEQKLRIVEALKTDGQIVAMTGDGVNDAPSLKAAHIGVAMGGRGTDVAREASSIVLLDDDFGSIVTAIRLGRRIYDNLRKAMSFIVAVHVPIAGLALLPLILGLPIIFSPIHIAFLELVIDPVCSLVFEAEKEEEDIMRRPPRSPAEPLLPPPLIGWGALQGAVAFAMSGGMFVFALRNGMPDDDVRALTFVSLILGIFSLILVNRSFSSSLKLAVLRPNVALLLILLGVCITLGLCLWIPALRELFQFGVLHIDDLALVAGAALLVLFALELLKLFWHARLRT
jgi:Ca2+-transporting ATPase